MLTTRLPYPAVFRQQMIDLVRSGRMPEELTKKFEPTAQTVRDWTQQAEWDDGLRHDGLTTAEREDWGARWLWPWRTTCCIATTGASLPRTSGIRRLMFRPRKSGKKTPPAPRRDRSAVAGGRADQADVSGRGAVRAHLRYPAVLVSKADASPLPGHGVAAVYLCVRGRLGG